MYTRFRLFAIILDPIVNNSETKIICSTLQNLELSFKQKIHLYDSYS